MKAKAFYVFMTSKMVDYTYIIERARLFYLRYDTTRDAFVLSFFD